MNATSKTAVGLLLALASMSMAFGQNAAKPISLVVPFSAGGFVDVVGREVALALSETMKQTVIVENAPGAGGIIAARKVLDATADGNTVILASPSQLILAGIVNKDVKFKSEDFRAVHMLGHSPYAIMVRADLPVRDTSELAELARSAAKKGAPLSYASVGFGTVNHVLAEDLSRRLEAPLVHIPYKGGADVMRDLVGGRVDIFINMYTAQQISLAEEGRFRFLSALSPVRQPLLPKVPAVDEAGPLKGFYAEVWSGLFVRRDVDDAVLANLNKSMAKVMAESKVSMALQENAGMRPARPNPSPAAVAREYAEGVQQMRELAKVAGIVN